MPPRPSSHVFRPRLPLDPFATDSEPWNLSLPPLLTNSTQSHVILILGVPSFTDLAPLTSSPFLANSLIILATHTPPPISLPSSPAIIILHLPAPLAIHDSGALRLVSLLERAQRVVHTWFVTRSSSPRIQQLAEQHPGGEFTRHEAVELASQPPSPTHSPTPPRRALNPSPADDSLSLSPTLSASSIASSKSSRHSRIKFSGPNTKAARNRLIGVIPFTALINFLPPTLPDKALLKHAVLVTTLSSPFLKAAASTNPHFLSTSPYGTKQSRSLFSHSQINSNSTPNLPATSRKRSRISFLFSSSSSSSPTPSTSAAPSLESLSIHSHSVKGKEKHGSSNLNSKPHVIHVLPYSAFFPSSSSSSSSSLNSNSGASTSTLSPHRQNRLSMRGSSDHGTSGMGWGSAGTNMMNGSARSSMPSSWSYPHLSQSLPPNQTVTSRVLIKPQARKTKLVQSIEHFLLSHAYPLVIPPNSNSPSSRPTSLYSTYSMSTVASSFPPHHASLDGHGQLQTSVVPFLVPAGVLGCVPLALPQGKNRSRERGVTGLSIGEMLLLGVLDSVAAGGEVDTERAGEGGGNAGKEWGWPRAWIGDGADVVLDLPTSRPAFDPASLPSAPLPVYAPMVGEVVPVASRDRMERETDRQREEVSMQRLQVPRGYGFGHGEENHDAYREKLGQERKLNEGGLPTPPESSSSLDGEGEVGSEESDGIRFPSPVSSKEEGERGRGRKRWIGGRSRVIRTRGWTVGGDDDRSEPGPVPWRGRSLSESKLNMKEDGKGNLKTRLSNFFRLGLGINGRARGQE